MLARRRGATFVPVDLTHQLARIGMSAREDTCTLAPDGRSLVARTPDGRGFARVAIDGDRLLPADDTEFRGLVQSLGASVRYPVLSADQRTLYYFVEDSAAGHRDRGPSQGSFVAERPDTRHPFALGQRLQGRVPAYQQITGVSSDGRTLFLVDDDWRTAVLVRESARDEFDGLSPWATTLFLPGWRTTPLGDCSRLLTTSAPHGCHSEDIVYLEPADP
jgi:hypothetical protein